MVSESKQDRDWRNHCTINKIKYEKKPPDTTINALNELNDTMGMILIELRRMNDVLEYLELKER